MTTDKTKPLTLERLEEFHDFWDWDPEENGIVYSRARETAWALIEMARQALDSMKPKPCESDRERILGVLGQFLAKQLSLTEAADAFEMMIGLIRAESQPAQVIMPSEDEIGDYISTHVPVPWPEVNPEEVEEVQRARTAMQAAVEWAINRINLAPAKKENV